MKICIEWSKCPPPLPCTYLQVQKYTKDVKGQKKYSLYRTKSVSAIARNRGIYIYVLEKGGIEKPKKLKNNEYFLKNQIKNIYVYIT